MRLPKASDVLTGNLHLELYWILAPYPQRYRNPCHLAHRKPRSCLGYIKASRKSIKAYKDTRKPLVDLLINTIRKSIRSKDWKRS